MKPMPKLSDEEIGIVRDVYKNMRKVYASVKETRKQPELTNLVMRLLSASPFGTRSDEIMQSMKVDVWVEQLEKYPLWAIKKAYDWQFQLPDKKNKEIILADFIQDVNIASGSPDYDFQIREYEHVKYRILHEVIKSLEARK